MANLRFSTPVKSATPASSTTAGSIRRAKELIHSQFLFLEEHPELAPQTFRPLRRIELQLEEMSLQHPNRVNTKILQSLLNNLSSIVKNLHTVAYA